jgi:hypothetical protein
MFIRYVQGQQLKISTIQVNGMQPLQLSWPNKALVSLSRANFYELAEYNHFSTKYILDLSTNE